MLQHSDDNVVLVDDNVVFITNNVVLSDDSVGALRQPACTV